MTRRITVITTCVVCTAAGGYFALATRPGVDPEIPLRVVNSVTSFASDHPEWAVLRDARRDTTPLLMGHAIHMDPNLPGGPLSCVSCHVVDSTGHYMQPISFDAHCAQCHEANLGRINVAEGLVDPLTTPHGSVENVLNAIDARLNALVAAHPEKFLISPDADEGGESATEPEQPASGGRRRGRASQPQAMEIPRFASVESRGAWLNERREAAIARVQSSCSYCHVAPSQSEAGAEWTIVSPAIPDRWMPRSHYSHAAHSMISCDQCHAARTSNATADILMPGINSCRECHQPLKGAIGGAPTDCVLCHTYHAPAPVHEGALRTSNLHRGGGSTPAAD